MNIISNVLKYYIVFALCFFVPTFKIIAQNNVSGIKSANLSLVSLAMVSGFDLDKNKSVPYTGTLNIYKGNQHNRKVDIHISDTTTKTNIPSILPSDVLNFSAIVSNNNALLQWKASNLPDIQKLIVEQSMDGISFQEVSDINLSEKINGIILSQGDGLSYYRLKMLDSNGNPGYTEALSCNVNTQATGIVSIFPNSITDEWLTALKIATTYRGKIKVVISDDHGQQLIEFHREIISEQTRIPIGVATIPKGSYYIFVSKNDGSHIGCALELVKN